jgi:DNA-directed RNA polymerase specialized sigma24 family protein
MYLSRVICNTAIELYHARQRQRRQQCPVSDRLPASADFGEPDRCLCEQEASTARARHLELLREGLARLPFKQYQALRLTVLGPVILSIRDAGAAHSIPYSTLRHRSLQGIRQLRRFLNRALRAAPNKLVLA